MTYVEGSLVRAAEVRPAARQRNAAWKQSIIKKKKSDLYQILLAKWILKSFQNTRGFQKMFVLEYTWLLVKSWSFGDAQ